MVAAGGVGLRDALYGNISADLTLSEAQRFENFAMGKLVNAEAFIARADVVAEDNCFVFLGDTGQGDAVASIGMLSANPSFGAAFLHAVPFVGDDAANSPVLQPSTASLAPGVIYFRTAVGAAIQAMCGGMASSMGLQSVLNSVRASAQRTACLTPCTPSGCIPFTSTCVDSSCEADPTTGYAPGCASLLCELKLADQLLANTQSCAQVVPQVDATPAYANAPSGVAPQCDTLATMAAYEASMGGNSQQRVDAPAPIASSPTKSSAAARSSFVLRLTTLWLCVVFAATI